MSVDEALKYIISMGVAAPRGSAPSAALPSPTGTDTAVASRN